MVAQRVAVVDRHLVVAAALPADDEVERRAALLVARILRQVLLQPARLNEVGLVSDRTHGVEDGQADLPRDLVLFLRQELPAPIVPDEPPQFVAEPEAPSMTGPESFCVAEVCG